MRSLETKMQLNARDINGIKEELKGIKSNTVWILRFMVGAIVGAILAELFRSGF